MRWVGVVAASLLVLAGAALAQGSTVTMSLSQERNVNGVLVLIFSGTVPSDRAGETVEIVGQDCGTSGFRILGGTQTRAGGGWRHENPESTPPWRSWAWQSGITFRARWNDQLSDPVVLRVPAGLWARKIPGRRAWKVHTSPRVSMAGEVVELQRRVGSRWVRYARAKLVRKASFDLGPYNHEATFEVPRRRLLLRGFLPRKTALPCYLPSATEPWRT